MKIYLGQNEVGASSAFATDSFTLSGTQVPCLSISDRVNTTKIPSSILREPQMKSSIKMQNTMPQSYFWVGLFQAGDKNWARWQTCPIVQLSKYLHGLGDRYKEQMCPDFYPASVLNHNTASIRDPSATLLHSIPTPKNVLRNLGTGASCST